MDLYLKVRQKRKNPLQIIAERAGVTTDYVRKILSGRRDGTKHCDSKGAEIIRLAEELLNN